MDVMRILVIDLDTMNCWIQCVNIIDISTNNIITNGIYYNICRIDMSSELTDTCIYVRKK